MRKGFLSGLAADNTFKSSASVQPSTSAGDMSKSQQFLGLQQSERLIGASGSDMGQWAVGGGGLIDNRLGMVGGATTVNLPHPDTSVTLAFSHHGNGHNKENDDVELMSSDSSSTSSSDE
jgi:hypothetical protein